MHLHQIQGNLKQTEFLKFFLFGLSLLFSSTGLAQTDDAYLDALEGEASDLTLDTQTHAGAADKPQQAIEASVSKEWQAGSGSETSQGMVQGLSQQEFEEALQINYIGSYVFYQRLPDVQKAEVFVFYQTSQDPAEIRKKILQLAKRK